MPYDNDILLLLLDDDLFWDEEADRECGENTIPTPCPGVSETAR